MIRVSYVRDFLIYLSSMLTILVSIIFIILTLYPFQVLTDWTMTVDKTSYYEGQTVMITSHFNKTMDAQPHTERGLECKNKNGTLQLYPVFPQSAGADIGTHNNTYDLVIPRDIINGLPTQCRVAADVVYNIFIVRQVSQHARSEFFTVNPIIQDEVVQ